MPLPSLLNGAKQCQVLTKRTRQQCKNPAAYGCASCRMHGAHKSRNVLHGKKHPQYKSGAFTKESKKIAKEATLRLRVLEQIGWHLKMFEGARTRGKRPDGFLQFDLNDPEQMCRAILMTLV